MRRIFFIAAVILVALTGTTFATRNYRPVGVLIIDDPQIKLGDYFGAVEGLLKPKSRARVFVGKKMQSQYQKYSLGFGKEGERQLTDDDLIEFTRLSGCRKVLFLINSASDDDGKNSLRVDAYLCTNDGVQETFTATEKFDNIRERRGAFRKCLTEICKTLNQIL